MSELPVEDEAATLRRLVETPELIAAIAAESGSEFQVQARLRRRFPAELVRMGLEIVALRRRAQGKFTRAHRLWLTRQGLEQATPETVARHKARRFAQASGTDPVWDLCCGVGGDALALAEVRSVVAVDADPAQLLRTQLNAAAYGVAARLETLEADVTTLDLAGRLVHVDPDRRRRGERTLRLERVSPPLAWLQELTRRARGGAIKVSPASNFGGKFPHAEVELVSLDGECKEATIWFGELRSDQPWRATVLPEGVSLAGPPLAAATDVRPIGPVLYDPDPAVVRAGLVDLLAVQTGLWRLDAAEEYLSGDECLASPFCTPFAVEEVLPNNATAIRQAIRRRGWGEVEIKCRHVQVDADAIRRKLPLAGGEAGVLVFARLAGRTHALLAKRLRNPDRSAAE
jgi:SAM-dependent methyltransferase